VISPFSDTNTEPLIVKPLALHTELLSDTTANALPSSSATPITFVGLRLLTISPIVP